MKNFNLFPAKSFFSWCAVLAVCVSIVGMGDPCAAGLWHKVRVANPAVAKKLVALGADLVEDYGSFQLLKVSDDLLQQSSEGLDLSVEDDMDVVSLNAGPIETASAHAQAARPALAIFAGKRLHLIQFAGPIKPEWFAELEKMGVQIVTYIPQNTYLIYVNHGAMGKVRSWATKASFVQWDGSYLNEYKIHPKARNVDAKGHPQKPDTDLFAVQMLDDPAENGATLAVIDALKTHPIKNQFRALNYLNVIVRLPTDQLAKIAARPEVISIQPYAQRKKFCERQDQIVAGNLSGNIPGGPGYLDWLTGKGFTQAQFTNSGFSVDVTDSGIDNATSAPGHFGLYVTGNKAASSRVTYSRLEGTANTNSSIQGCDGHGNLNAHIIGGYDDLSGFPFADTSGYHYGLGICPFVRVGSSVIFDPDYFTSPNYPNLASRAYRDGARISNNSWGGGADGSYDIDCQVYDALVRDAQPTGSAVPVAGNQQMTFVFAAGNEGSDASTIGSPGSAKNVITVGAGESVQAFGGTDASGISDSGANSANDMTSFSSRGPCTDGRQKPDICAPGTHVSGGVAQVASSDSNGTAIACFDGTGVSGGVSSSYFPSSGQQYYTAGSGTSHSTPAVAGCCALVRQYFINSNLTVPSPAMTKAYLMNSTRYMTGTGANDALWSSSQGMGSANLGMAFDGVARLLRDQLNVDRFTASGQTRSFTGTISDPAKPFRVTLAWTDAPGSTSGNAFKNDLNLAVTVGGLTYKGNVFAGANSTTGGSADTRNNVESVFVPAGVTGNFLVTVTAANINSDGVPNDGPALDQDFALVVYNGHAVATPFLIASIYALTSGSCLPTNAVVDANETVTIAFTLQNGGSLPATNLVATLLAIGGVSNPGSSQIYGALSAGSSFAKPFTFQANTVCGGTVTATLQLQDGSANYGIAAFVIPTGTTATNYSENFDGVSSPALPSGWTTASSGAQSAWTTSPATSHTAPNAVFSPDPSAAGVNELISTPIILSTANAQLSFRNNYALEASSTTGYDGGVLEIKVGSGAFTDILAAGGSFVTGGYNRVLSSSFSNPLGGRQAWSGTNGSYVTTLITLPASAGGQAVQFKWRCASDSSSGGGGWRIDTVTVSGPSCCGDSPLPIVLSQPQSQSVEVGNNAVFTVLVAGQSPFTYQWRKGGGAINNATNSFYNLTNVQVTTAGNYDLLVSNSSGSVTSAVAVLTVITPPTNSSTLAQWNFNSVVNDTNSTTGISAPSVGTGTATMVGGVTATYTVGSGNDSSIDNSAWILTTYPTAFASNKSAGPRFNVSTVGRRNIIITWDQRTSNTGSKYSRLQYSTNGATFIDYPTPIVIGTAATFESKSNSLVAIPEVNDNSSFAFRIVSEWEITAVGGSSGYVAALNTSTYAPSGTVRFDMVTVSSEPLASLPAVLGSAVYSNNGVLQFNVTGTAGSLYVVQSSTNLVQWVPLVTNFSSFTFSHTNGAANPARFFRAVLAP